MMDLSPTNIKNSGWCNACYEENHKDLDTIFELSLSISPRQSYTVRFCPKCLKELKRKINIVMP